MKNLKSIIAVGLVGILMASCANTNNVVSNKLITKRKYTKGFHFNKKSHLNNRGEEVAQEDFKVERTKKHEERTSQRVSTKENSTSQESVEYVEVAAVETPVERSYTVNDQSSMSDDLGDTENQTIVEDEELQSSVHDMSVQEMTQEIRQAATSGDTSDIIFIILVIILIILAFALLDKLTGGTFGWIVGLVLTILLIWLILRWLGVI